MNGTDTVIMGVISVSAIFSIVRGFLRELISLAAWFAAFWVSFRYLALGATYLEGHVSSPSLRLGISFFVIFLFILLIGGIINYFFGKFIKKSGLSGMDRCLGIFFGLARGILIVTLALVFLSVSPTSNEPWWRDSVLVPFFHPLIEWLRGFLPDLNKLLTSR